MTQSNSGQEWPSPVSAEESNSPSDLPNWGRPALKPHLSVGAQSVTAEERQRLAVLQVQYKAVDACRQFLLKVIGSDDDEDKEENDGSEEFGDFILKTFVEDSELRNYYQKNYEAGEFCCLICGALAKKNFGRKFRDCVGLVQHAMAMSVKKQAHRAFGETICKVLGLDIDRLPTIVIKGEPLGCPLPMKQLESETLQGELNADDGRDGSEVLNDQVVSVERSVEAVEQDLEGVYQTINQVSRESLVSDVEWVWKSPNNDSTTSGWRPFNSQSAPQTCSLSAEEQASVAVLRLQHKALEACQEFLVDNVDSDYDEEYQDELMDDYESEENEEKELENEEFKFLRRLFTEDSDLRRYYENNHGEGDFYCLVCGGIGKKVWKRFKNCNALLQHSIAVLRTTRKRAHRAYAQIICEVLGWDIDRLSNIVLKGKPFGSSLSQSVNDEPEKPSEGCLEKSNVEPEKPADGHSDDSSVVRESLGKVNNDLDIVCGEDHVVHHSNGGHTDSTCDKHIT
ncbi:hypothetical protein L6164_018352 [Bauhinia variegata]|uniref:Uncharacterized protein n=1 Tax=Bauhinia variegata TaxID=167791 RepID=A0ACB9NCN6_BAUVA|nr:hypothetical protein L6164_018352 [Bauhinia variegata]